MFDFPDAEFMYI